MTYKPSIHILNKIGGDLQVAQCAWTSTISQTKQETKTEEDVKRVVQMLIRDKHTSPLESVVMTFLYQDWENKEEYPVARMQDELGNMSQFRHAVIHELAVSSPLALVPEGENTGKYTWMITINFHALMKYRNKHHVFKELYGKVKTEGFMGYAIEQIESDEK
jgi:hypothetical protein